MEHYTIRKWHCNSKSTEGKHMWGQVGDTVQDYVSDNESKQCPEHKPKNFPFPFKKPTQIMQHLYNWVRIE